MANTIPFGQSTQPKGTIPFGGGAAPVPSSQSLSDGIWSSMVPKPDPLASVHIGGSAQPANIFSQIKSAASAGADQINQGVTDIGAGSPGNNPVVGGVEDALKVGSGIASVISSPLAPLFSPVSKIIQDTGNKIADIPAVQTFATSQAGINTARVAGDVANAGNIAGTILGVDQAAKFAQTVPSKVSGALDTAKSSFASSPKTPSVLPEVDTGAILNSYNKAIKPTVAGKTGPGQLDAYNNKVVSAVKSIADNKEALSFETDSGTEAGRLPQTRGELADAVAQTKQQIFKQYDALAQQAGEKGVQVPLDSAGSALDEVVNNEALKLVNPKVIEFAKDMQSRFLNPDGTYKAVTPEIAQQAIANFNTKLKAFYRNPTYESASNAAVEAGVVSELRNSIDEAINNATGENYQALKNQYGALSSIEKDVNKAAIAQAKATGTNTMGLGKYVDVFSGGDMVGGLLSLNPALFAKGAAQSGISHFFQWLNSPDRAVKTMFNATGGALPSK